MSNWHLFPRRASVRANARETTPVEIDGLPAEIRCPLGRANARSSVAGSSILEFALVVPTFLFLLFALVDFARLFYVEVTLQNAVRQAGRYAITGNHMADPNHPGQNLSRMSSIVQVAQNSAEGLDVAAIQVSSLNGGNGSAGGPGDTVTISLTTNLKLMTGYVAQFFKNGTYTFTVSVSFKNESFSPNNTT